MDIDETTDALDVLKISGPQAYELVKTGHWTIKQFGIWVRVVIDAVYEHGKDIGERDTHHSYQQTE